jgi:hypothetical protein
VVVTVRVDSSDAGAPLFEGAVDTLAHAVDGGDGSGAHPCAGSPAGPPSPTATGALDDALRGAGIPWHGNWDPSFHDFFIDRIGPYASQAPDRYWSLTVNGRFSAGGCLAQVGAGDSIRFFYGPLFGPGPSAPGGAADPAATPPGESGGHGSSSGASRKRLRQVAGRAFGFLREHSGVGEQWARLVLSLHRGAGAAASARALIATKLGAQLPGGSFEHNVNTTALAILALRDDRPKAAARAVAWLANAQSPGGGFGYRPGVPPDLDTTGLASWALAAGGRRAATRRAADFVRSAQSPAGGFPALPGGEPNSQSTGLATIALRVSGLSPRRALSDAGRSPLDYLVSLARRNGAIAYQPHSSPTPVWTTSQALLGLMPRAKLLGLDADGRAG